MEYITGRTDLLNLTMSDKSQSRGLDMGNPNDLGRSDIPLDDGSRDSGLGSDEDNDEDSCFASPMAVRRKLPIFDEDACSPLKYSPVKNSPSTVDFRSVFQCFPDNDANGCTSPSFLKSRVRWDYKSENQNHNDNVNLCHDRQLPESYRKLFSAPLLNKNDDSDQLIKTNGPTKTVVFDKFLHPNIRPRCSQKRQRHEQDGDQSQVLKKRREMCLSDKSYSLETSSLAKVNLRKFHSDSEAIKTTLDRVVEYDDLIGDGSQTFCLPTIPGKHQDLKSISPETLSEVLNHDYDHVIEQFVIVDCRYPYEYNGGHIMGAENYYTKDLIMEKLVKNPIQTRADYKRTIVIFHCEFSSERGPKMCRFLRNMDRSMNKDRYPDLFYPEVYLLHGGYQEFYQNQKELCTPQSYTPMYHEDYRADMRTFRQKCKSWSGDQKKRPVRRMSLRL